jgi:hypothetical protein
LAYKALSNRSKTIAAFLLKAAGKGRSMIVLDSAQFSAIPAYRAFQFQLGTLTQAYCALMSPPDEQSGEQRGDFRLPTATQFSAAAAAVTAALAIFKQNTAVTPVAQTIEDRAAIASIRESLGSDVSMFFYGTDFPSTISINLPSPPLYHNVTDACADAAHADSIFQKVSIAEFLRYQSFNQAGLLSKTQKGVPLVSQKVLDSLSVINSAFDALINSLSTVDATTKANGWQAITSGELIENRLKQNPVVVEIKVQTAGGAVTTRDGILFLHGAQYSYAGGIIITVLAFDAKTTALLASANFYEVIGNKPAKEMNGINDGH